MRQLPKTIRKTVRVLTDPIPEFVSLVGRGANQTPFRVVKMDPTALIDEDKEMPKEQVIRQGDTVIKRADIVKIDFSAANFPTEDAVTTFLTERGYEDFTVAKSDGGFTVAGRAEDEFETGSTSPIELRPGAVVTVGKLSVAKVTDAEDPPATPSTSDVPTDPPEEGVHKDADGGADDGSTDGAEGTKKADAGDKDDADDKGDKGDKGDDPHAATRKVNPDLAKKFDDWIAQFSNADNLKDVMKTGADGLPPGMGEITGAMFTALRNVLGRGDNDAVEGIAGEFAEMVVKLAKAFPFATITQQVDDVERDAGDAKDDNGIAKIVRDAMKAAVGDISGLAENINIIKTVTDKTAEQTTEVITRMTTMEQRVTDLEKVRQTRKGADHDDAETEQTEEVQRADEHAEKMRRNSFGIG